MLCLHLCTLLLALAYTCNVISNSCGHDVTFCRFLATISVVWDTILATMFHLHVPRYIGDNISYAVLGHTPCGFLCLVRSLMVSVFTTAMGK